LNKVTHLEGIVVRDYEASEFLVLIGYPDNLNSQQTLEWVIDWLTSEQLYVGESLYLQQQAKYINSSINSVQELIKSGTIHQLAIDCSFPAWTYDKKYDSFIIYVPKFFDLAFQQFPQELIFEIIRAYYSAIYHSVWLDQVQKSGHWWLLKGAYPFSDNEIKKLISILKDQYKVTKFDRSYETAYVVRA
jgi:hypothetical protein